jgi:hypothetical protein
MWAEAMRSGDQAALQRSVEALQTSRDWPMLHEIADQGGYSSAVWELADRAKQRDRTMLEEGGLTFEEDGTKFTYGPAYATALGCASARRHRIDAE